MDTTLTLDEFHYKTVVEKARAIGKTPAEYLQILIDADNLTFDEMLAPARKGFEGMSDDDVNELVDRAQKAARRQE
jgi:hypothetical protein